MFFRFRYFRKARDLMLPSAKKEEVRDALRTYMHGHPVRATAPARLLLQRSAMLRPALAFGAILLIIGGGTASAAERALPDNVPLYFIKTEINEPIRRTLAVTPEAKANVDAALSARRLEEAEVLAKTDRLTPVMQKKVEDRFVEQVEKTQARISALKDDGKEREAKRLNAKLETSLEAHGDALVDASQHRTTSTREAIAPVIKRVREQKDALVRERKEQEAEERREKREQRKDDRFAPAAEKGSTHDQDDSDDRDEQETDSGRSRGENDD